MHQHQQRYSSRLIWVGAVGALLLGACGQAITTTPPTQPAADSAVASQATTPPAPEPTAMPEPTAIPEPTPQPQPAPELVGGGAWVNSEPLTLAGLQAEGKVTLVNFWTYTCYNCQNTLPYVRQWWDKYKDQGLVIVGVHTPEFDSEKKLENVQAAVQREEIGWPVVQDNDYTIWRAYHNRYWPRFYLIDHHGNIIYDHIGEGAYDETERHIQAALAART